MIDLPSKPLVFVPCESYDHLALEAEAGTGFKVRPNASCGNDPLSAARGMARGVVIGAFLWVLILAPLFFYFRNK